MMGDLLWFLFLLSICEATYIQIGRKIESETQVYKNIHIKLEVEYKYGIQDINT